MSFQAFLDSLFLIAHFVSAALLVAVILLQGGRGASMSAAFGGGSASAFGARTDEVMVKATAWCAAVFLVASISLSLLTERVGAAVQRAPAGTFETVSGAAYVPPPSGEEPPGESALPSPSPP